MQPKNHDEFTKFPESQEGNAQLIRERLAAYKPRLPSRKMALTLQFLTASRVSEVVGKYAFQTANYTTTKYDNEEVILLTMNTAKRKGRERYVALPLNPSHEPLAKKILEYLELCKKQNRKKPFSFKTRTLQYAAKDCFNGLTYMVEQRGKIERHQRRVSTHGLRHFRATELMMKYGFDSIDLAIFCGWTLKTATGLGIADRYISYQWQRYFPKLLQYIREFQRLS